MSRQAAVPAIPNQRALVTAFLKALLVPSANEFSRTTAERGPFWGLLWESGHIGVLISGGASVDEPADRTAARAAAQTINAAIEALSADQIDTIADLITNYAEDEPANYIGGLRKLVLQSPANADAVALLMAAAPAANLEVAAATAHQELLRRVQELGAEAIHAAAGNPVVENIIRHQFGMDAQFNQALQRLTELSRKTSRSTAENLELLRESDRLNKIVVDKGARLSESASAFANGGTAADGYPFLAPDALVVEALRLQAVFAANRAAALRPAGAAAAVVPPADPVAELRTIGLGGIEAAISAVTPAVPALAPAAARNFEEVRAIYKREITAKGGKSPDIERFIAENQAKIDRMRALLKEAQGLVEQQTAALAAGNAAGLVPDIRIKIAHIEIAVEELKDEIEHAVANVFPRLLEEAQLKTAVQLRETEEKDEADSKQAAADLVAGFADAVKQFVRQRKAADIEAHGLQWLKRKVGWGIDALWGDSYDSRASKQAREDWLKLYNDRNNSILYKLALRIAVVLSVIAAAPITALQYISYGFTKFLSSIRALWNGEQGAASKFAVRLGILLAVVATLLLLAIPGINVAVAAIFIVPLAIAAWSGLTYLARGAKYSLQPTALTEVKAGVRDPYKGKQVDGAEVGATPGTRVTIDLDREKLQGLLKVVDQMEQALLDQNRALSADESQKLATYREQIVAGNLPVIKGFLAELNTWNKQANSTAKPVTIADLESAESKRARAATAASVPVATPAAPAPDLSAAVLRALQTPVAAAAPAPAVRVAPPTPARAASAYPQAGAAAGYAGIALPPVTAVPTGHVAPPPPPPTAAVAAAATAGAARGGVAAPMGAAMARSAPATAPAPSRPPIAPVMGAGSGGSAARTLATAGPGTGTAPIGGGARSGRGRRGGQDASANYVARL